MSAANDVEIYVCKLSTTDAVEWLKKHFDGLSQLKKAKGTPKGMTPIELVLNEQVVRAFIYEEVEPNFTSIWFKSIQLPWPSDEQCAQSAARELNTKVRIPEGSWNFDNSHESWVEIDSSGKKKAIQWKMA